MPSSIPLPSEPPQPSATPAPPVIGGVHYALHISRADNGWIVQHVEAAGETYLTVHTDVHASAHDVTDSDNYARSASLLEALYDAFDGCLRTKRRCGLVITNHKEGYENDPVHHTDDKYVFYGVTKPIELPGVTILPDTDTDTDTDTDNVAPSKDTSHKPSITLKELQDLLNARQR